MTRACHTLPDQRARYCALIVIVGLLLLNGAGCANDAGSTQRAAPRRIDRTLAGTPPGAFPPGTTDEQKLTEIRAHLDRLDEREPDAVVLAYVFLKELIDVDILASWMRDYDLEGGGASSLLVRTDDDGIVGLAIPSVASTTDSLMERIRVQMAVKQQDVHIPNHVSSFALYGHVRSFERLWTEKTKIVRGIGVLGRRGEERILWYPIDIGAPVR